MRRLLLTAALLALPPLAARADTLKSPELSSSQCGVGTDYDVLVDGGGIWLRRHDTPPREIVFHDGQLSIDGHMQAVSDADAQRLRVLEAGVRQLMPAVTGIANESVGISFDVLDVVHGSLTGKFDSRKVRVLRRDAERFVASTIGRGRWEQDLFGEGFDQRVQDAAESLKGSIARGVLWTMLTGGEERIEKRTEKIEAELEPKIEARARALEQHAQSLCTQVLALDRIQSALEFRYDGQPLRMMRVSGDDAPAPVAKELAPDNGITLP
ncbi:hypothetical protein ABB34_06175 [Stenotrophomonas daejeonensis]|uniref:DUF2884 family protein n=1 Tax=Stenotrophomonas daejeonensis TaxID=659018 RepID=A0A0R0E5N1_9GAMM|nr:DUF2884 family protein [Stenotrophomonas daejeonensis]KRG86738.1 hypothetical protein ABB34_06175 [Stenotrophomonas daejeonensis]